MDKKEKADLQPFLWLRRKWKGVDRGRNVKMFPHKRHWVARVQKTGGGASVFGSMVRAELSGSQ